MSERLSHDLPEYVPNTPVPLVGERAKVYKYNAWWTWHHRCLHRPESTPHWGFPHRLHATALGFALRHMERCL